MKRIVKRAMTLALSAVLAVGCLTGCSGSGSSDSKVFKIGATGPLTGGAAAYGDAVKKGAQIAVDEINAAGGIACVVRSVDDVKNILNGLVE